MGMSCTGTINRSSGAGDGLSAHLTSSVYKQVKCRDAQYFCRGMSVHNHVQTAHQNLKQLNLMNGIYSGIPHSRDTVFAIGLL